ncbi:hypothetical protein PAECIP112173_02521 [Paenibacillus sp. JJ-100]|uniref:hypothetical protein n=1 Tax=Paenibacillus sp. JJ-100 TaxID=2974896 RepID=UPI0022FFB49F|nr:hypothetical protein [Paenibacillus sp. JJ-100]CAI6078016.1 hypothetical protein PAECIP112173_02521 [Paenibacillus sp. JJ-100]
MRRVVSAFLVLILCVLSLIAWPGQLVYACSCVDSNAKEKLVTYTAVFTGKVVDIGGGSIFSTEQYKKYTLDVDTAWKGVDAKQMEILINSMGSDSCGASLVKDQSYLIFAYKNKKDGQLHSNLCSGNLPIEQAGVAIEMMGAGTPVSSDDFRGSSGYRNPWMISLYGGGSVVILALAGRWLWRKKRRKA